MLTTTPCILVAFLAASCSALYSSSFEVVKLTPSNFDRLVTQSDSIWIVQFFAPWCGHCKNLVPSYTLAAKALKGTMQMGAVNVDEYKSLGEQFGVRGFPTIKMFGEDKHKPEGYNGQRTTQGFIDAAFAALRHKVDVQMRGNRSGIPNGDFKPDLTDVVKLTDANFDSLVLESNDLWLVEFYAPWCGHCKKLEHHWAQAASKLKGKAKLGALDATVNKIKTNEYGVQGYPTIKVFASGKKDSKSALEYEGGRTASDIVNWAVDQLDENLPAPEILELINATVLQATCEKRSLCIISVLPHILDCQADCRNSYLDVLKQMSEKYKSSIWGWAWVEAGAQPELEQTLEMGGFGYPALAVINIKKMKYSILRGAFSSDGINVFLRDLGYKSGSTRTMKGDTLPGINPTDAWDGKDRELPAEEEIDLSDVVLDDIKDEL